MKIYIDHTEIEVTNDMSVMDAASLLGISIPSMCFMKGRSNHPSCMICMVEDEKTGNLFPSCAMPVSDGMKILTRSDAVLKARREALELLLSDHRGDCEAPCKMACPAHMNIPGMNRMVAKGETGKALQIIREEIAIPLILGYICDAPCEKVCHRRNIDGPVAICSVKLYASVQENYLEDLPLKDKKGKKVLVIGAGPAGLSSAYFLLSDGFEVDITDEKASPGGSLLEIPSDKLPPDALTKETEVIQKLGGKFFQGKRIEKDQINNMIGIYDAVIIAAGTESDLYRTGNVNVFDCRTSKGGMAVKASAAGKETARKVIAYLTNSNNSSEKIRFNSHAGKLTPEDQAEYLKEEIKVAQATAEKSVNEAARCMHCDCRKSESCKLRIYSDEYGANKLRFRSEEKKTIRKELQHDLVAYEPQKCIRCGLCIEISSSDPSSSGMAFFGRGYDVEIVPALNSGISEALKDIAVACAETCPTGAISIKEE